VFPPRADGSGLGLARERVVVRPYDGRWPRAFADEEARLRALVGALARAIEHVGSTAVAGLAAKPVLDVAIAYADRSALAAMRALLAQAGYEDRGDQGERGGVVVVKGPPACRTHHLHLVAAESAQWRSYLAFRDALRRDPSLRSRYAALKEELAARFPDDRVAYTDGKDEFVASTLAGLTTPPRAGGARTARG
jgi:GrpB-like predicted nucleotidyltransferase (UPF0157 family)